MVNTMDFNEGIVDEIALSIGVGTVASKLLVDLCDEAVAHEIATVELPDNCDDAAGMSQIIAGLTGMKNYFKNIDGESLHRVSVDFHQLFVGPDKLLAAPWSSVYLNRGYLFGEIEQNVELQYKVHGLANPEGHHAPCDHVAYEFQFVCELLSRALNAYDENDLEAFTRFACDTANFFETYIKVWINQFLTKVSDNAQTTFYQSLAQYCEGYIDLLSHLSEAISEQLGEPNTD